ncbi:MAG: holo-ACP synthase [Planctomycetales bacterium]|nr:holo-ACP synthase [Planctomycetales bacterium]
MRPTIAIGTDIIECDRVADMIEKHGPLFLERVYTVNERGYCQALKSATQSYAGRWAAKEAVFKVLGTGWSRGVQWTDVEVINEPGGKPLIRLSGKAAEIAIELGIDEVLISISHCRSHAVAYAHAVGARPAS